ncbi:hypothetical protein M441DRAFT_139154, partial [Trichoderma asperellum CBS 433.97]
RCPRVFFVIPSLWIYYHTPNLWWIDRDNGLERLRFYIYASNNDDMTIKAKVWLLI